MKLLIFIGIGVFVVFMGLKRCSSGSFSIPGLPGSSKEQKADPAASKSDAAPSVPPERPTFTTSHVVVFRNRLVPTVDALGRSTNDTHGAPVSWSIDPASNSVLVRGESKAVAQLAAALAQMDIPGEEAFIDGSMMFVRGDRVRDFEAAISYRESASPVPSASFSPAGFGVVLPWDRFNVSINWLSENGLLEVLDKPQLRLASGELSEIQTGSEVAIPVTTFGDAVSRTTVEFRRVGLTFRVRPLFLSEGRVRLDVEAENGVLGSPQKVGDSQIPTIQSQRIKTVATLSHDDGLVIGGLETVRRSKRFGLLGKSESVETGRLYLLLVLRSGAPKALPVGEFDRFNLPATLPGSDDFPGSLLPPRDWEEEERSFLRSRRHPSK